MDLPYVFGKNTYGTAYSPESKASSGDVILFSGCRDDQTASDTTVTTKYGKYSGGISQINTYEL